MIISISGVPGSGKTSVGKLLAERLEYHFYSVGGLRGKMALERGMTINELNKLGETDPTTDTSVDEYQRELGKKEDDFVIEGRLSWYFIPHSFKILLTCDPHTAAERIYWARQQDGEGRGDEPEYASPDVTRRHLEERTESDRKRYAKYYGLDYADASQYDVVMDTTNIQGVEAVTDVLEKQARAKIQAVGS